MSARLVLFDIDGTLVRCPPDTARVLAIKDVCGIDVSLDGLNIGGMTEPQILRLLLENAGWSSEQIATTLPKLSEAVDAFTESAFVKGTARLVDGVEDLLDELQKRDATLGLITGNRKKMARLKLEDAGIWHHFTVGGFGDDPHETRADLVRIAIERSGLDSNDPNIYVVGDTWRDIEAAAHAGVVNRVGLISPRHPRQEFEEAGANIILGGFSPSQKVLSAFGIN